METLIAAATSPAPAPLATADYALVHRRLRRGFDTGALRPYPARRRALRALRAAIKANEQRLFDALARDFGKPAFEAYTSEIGFCYQEIDHALSCLRRWMRPTRIGVGPALFPTTAVSYHQPKGVVLIVAPWNYPVNLTLGPLVAAIAAAATSP